jgi:transcriptional regulator GlxA family with amidase domain
MLSAMVSFDLPLFRGNRQDREVAAARAEARGLHDMHDDHQREMRAMLAEAWNVADRTAELARACGLSERTLFRKVRQVLGITPYELMLRIRVQKAAEELILSSAKIIEIAINHGFCDQSTFTQHFRKRIGMTPKEFRNRNKA